ncbi:MAG: nucleotidyltransferase domain-containing protein [Cyanobacteria bacterium J06626_23]
MAFSLISQAVDSIPEPETLEQRRQIAAAVADRCIQILTEEYGATEAFVFGSLRGDSPWHAASDMDLAVRGLSDTDVINAFDRLRRIVPEWLPYDLAPVDTLPERIRKRILRELPMPDNPYLALRERMADGIEAIDQSIELLGQVLSQAETIPEIALIPALTSYIDDFYSGCERISRRVAVALDGQLPRGSNWHKQLLLQLAVPGGQGPPPLWSQDLCFAIDDYRRFRHRIRHMYTGDLEPSRVIELAQQAPQVFAQMQQAVAVFSQWLVASA